MASQITLRHDDHVHGGGHLSGHSPDYSLTDLAAAANQAGYVASLREHAPLPLPFLARHPKAMALTPGIGTPVGLRLGAADNVDTLLAEVRQSGLPLGFEIDVLGEAWLADSIAVMDLLIARAAGVGLEIDCFNLSHHYPWDMTFGGLQRALAQAGGPERFLRGYFGSIRAYIRTGLFGAVSHLEAIRKFDRVLRPAPFAGSEAVYAEEVAATLATLVASDTALEYNTAGRATWGRAYLSPATIALAARLGVSFTVGSDAHSPARVGDGFDEGFGELAAAGVTELRTYRRRRPVAVPLDLGGNPGRHG